MQSNLLENFLYEKSLYYCISQKQYEAANTLIEKIEKSNTTIEISWIRNAGGKTLLHLLVDPNLSDIERSQANSILEKLVISKSNLIGPSDIEIADNAGNTVLTIAAANSNEYVLKLFIEKNLYTSSEALKIFPTLENNSLPKLHELAEKIRVVYPSDLKSIIESDQKITFEILAALAQSKNEMDFDELKKILEKEDENEFKIDINMKNAEGYSLVLIAAEHGNLKATELLLKNGAIPSITISEKGKIGRQVYEKISTKVFKYENKEDITLDSKEYKNLKEIRDLLNLNRTKGTIKKKHFEDEEKRQLARQKTKIGKENGSTSSENSEATRFMP